MRRREGPWSVVARGALAALLALGAAPAITEAATEEPVGGGLGAPGTGAARVPEETFSLKTDGTPYTTKAGLTFRLERGTHKHGKDETTGFYTLAVEGPGAHGGPEEKVPPVPLATVPLTVTVPEDWYGEGEVAGRLVRWLGANPSETEVKFAVLSGPVPSPLPHDELMKVIEAQLAPRGIATGRATTSTRKSSVRMTLGMGKRYRMVVIAGALTGELLDVSAPGPPPREGVSMRLLEGAWGIVAGIRFKLALKTHKELAGGGGVVGFFDLAWKSKSGAKGVVKLTAEGVEVSDWYREFVVDGRLVRLLGRRALKGGEARVLVRVFDGVAPKKKRVDPLAERVVEDLASIGYDASKGFGMSEEPGAITITSTTTPPGAKAAMFRAIVGPYTGDLLWVNWEAKPDLSDAL